MTATTTTAHGFTTRTPNAARALLAAAGLGLAAMAPAVHAQSIIRWATPTDGYFDLPANWFPAVKPGTLDTVILGGSGEYEATVRWDETIQSLQIPNDEATMAIDNRGNLAVRGDITGSGRILVNRSAGDWGSTIRVWNGSVVDTRIDLNAHPGDPATARILPHGPTGIATFGPNSVISGSGRLWGEFRCLGTLEATGDGSVIDFHVTALNMEGAATARSIDGGAFNFSDDTYVTGGTWDGGDRGVLLGHGGVLADATLNGAWVIGSDEGIALEGEIDGSGTLTVNPSGTDLQSILYLGDSTTINIPVVLNSRAADTTTAGILRYGRGPAPAIGPDGVVSGRGIFSGTSYGRTFHNDGLIHVAGGNDAIGLNACSLTQSDEARIEVDEGALTVHDSTIEGGAIEASNAGILTLDESRVSDIVLDAGRDGAVLLSLDGEIADAILGGDWYLTSGSNLELGGVVSGPGRLVVNQPASDAHTVVKVGDGAWIDTHIHLNAFPGDAATAVLSRSGLGTTPAIGPNGVVTGHGKIHSHFSVLGRIEANGPDETIYINERATLALGDDARIESVDGGGFVLERLSSVTGGTWGGGTEGALLGSGGVIADAKMEGSWGLLDGQYVYLAGDVEGGGTLTINRSGGDLGSVLYADHDAFININVHLNASDSDYRTAAIWHRGSEDAPTFGSDSTISGRGVILGAHVLSGTLAPGSGPDGIGVVGLDGAEIEFTATTRVEMDAGGTLADEHDRITGSHRIALDGALHVNFVEGYVPNPDDRFEIISASTVDGSFADIDIEPVGAIGPAHVVYTGDSVVVVICTADRDADGELTIFDFLEFQNQFDAGDLRADLDQDGQLTIFDFLAYQNAFDAGCG